MEIGAIKPAVVGLGYVGLPLLSKISEKYDSVGFDISANRIDELKSAFDRTGELNHEELSNLVNVKLTLFPDDIKECNFFIITVPTPVTLANSPDFTHLKRASITVAERLKVGDIVVYESTVFPGATEEICVPILEQHSNLKLNYDFHVGYSPERINPGDKKHRISDIVKVTSGSNDVSAKVIDDFYNDIIDAGTHRASSIRVAEAAKVIENTQRDVNIALVNELSTLFSELKLDTNEVLDAASTKWNFLNFRPGLVGGHCIGVDPYYLLHKASEVGFHPELIEASRRINDGMTERVVKSFLKNCLKRTSDILSKKILVLGATFKENCPDVRNSRVFDLVDEFESFGMHVKLYDPVANYAEQKVKYSDNIIDELIWSEYSGIIVAVPHLEFVKLGVEQIKSFAPINTLFFDLKGCFSKNESDFRI